MSIKKTWFSYILWLIATGFSIIFTYNTVSNWIGHYGVYGHKHAGGAIVYSALIIGAVILLCLLLRNVFEKVTLPEMNIRVIRTLHVCAFIGITGLFLYTRFWSFVLGGLNGDQLIVFYELNRNGFLPEEVALIENYLGNASIVPSVFESVYMKVIALLFSFFGNKLEIVNMMQVILQTVSLFSLYVIGWNMQKGFWAWIPALCYAASPICASMIGDFGPADFWICITLLGVVFVFLAQRLWKNRLITYVVMSLWGVCVCAFVFGTKFAVIFQKAPAFFVESNFRVKTEVMYIELFIVVVALLMYCVTFWFVKTDSASFYVLPAVLAAGLYLLLRFYECDVLFFLVLFIGFWVVLLVTESLYFFSKTKPKKLKKMRAVSKQVNGNANDWSEGMADDREDFEWTEMKALMQRKEDVSQTGQNEELSVTEEVMDEEFAESPVERTVIKDNLEEVDVAGDSVEEDSMESAVEEDAVSEDTGVIRVSDILKAAGIKETDSVNEEIGTDTEENVIDRKAPIENVLPMPKKHEPRTFEYAFEPSEDQMHYDVEVENDDYDYDYE